MRLTVVIPAYNAESTIERCLGALVDQKGVVLNRDFTILLVNDGSTDRTVEIASRFPVGIVNLEKNSGRLAARQTGAEQALTKHILLVDTRVEIDPDAVGAALALGEDAPPHMGNIRMGSEDLSTAANRVFYLIRRRYYGREYYPVDTLNLTVTKKNFKRAPKGTTILWIDRELFIRLNEGVETRISDDTLLLHRLVFDEGLPLERTSTIAGRYSSRTDYSATVPWLFHRGEVFHDFYLSKGGVYRGYLLAAGLILALLVVFLAAFPSVVKTVLAFLLFMDIAAAAYLSEKPGDIPTCLIQLPFLSAVFVAGALWHMAHAPRPKAEAL